MFGPAPVSTHRVRRAGPNSNPPPRLGGPPHCVSTNAVLKTICKDGASSLMKLFPRVFPLPVVFLCLVSLMTTGVRVASGQSITFSPAEKTLLFPAGVGPFSSITSDGAGNLFFPLAVGGSRSTDVVKVSPAGAESFLLCAGQWQTDSQRTQSRSSAPNFQ